MNDKGFTLVELLGVVVILMILAVLIVPKVIGEISDSEDVALKTQINEIIEVSKIYIQNTNKLPEENSLYVLSLDELKESELIEHDKIINPKTNDELTGCIFIKYEDNKYKYEFETDNERCNSIVTVTFDANGGTINQTSKNVLYNDTYGELPIPTREGYTFLGWNGKNLIDEDSLLKAISGCTVTDEGYYKFLVQNTHSKYGGGKFYTNFSENKQYTLSFTAYSAGTGTFQFTFVHIEGTSKYIKNFDASTTPQIYVLTSDAGKDVKSLSLSYGIGGYVFMKDMQLEEGDTATEYEPYFVSSSTTVTQNKDHTLKAIWQANE